MNTPNITCEILVDCALYPSEDIVKIKQALANMFPQLVFEEKKYTMHASSDNLQCLEKICQDITNKQLQKSFNKQFRKNIDKDSLWFYLNKQAAFVDVTALCEHDDESPLGPIKILIKSEHIDRIAQWLL